MMTSSFNVRQITRGPKFHFKPYYDMQPWDSSGRYFLCMESDFQDRPPEAGDALTLGMVDLDSDEFIPVAQTRAWNFQQGCMPHWLPTAAVSEVAFDRRHPQISQMTPTARPCIVPSAESAQSADSVVAVSEVIFNDRIEGAFRAIILNVHTRKRRMLPLPIQAVSPAGRFAASLNFARWGEWRPGYGYAGIDDPFRGEPQPGEEAVYLMNLQTGEYSPLVKLADVMRLTSDNDGRKGSPAWFNHLMFNTDGSRLVGLVRWWCPELADNAHNTRVNIDGAVSARRHCMWVINTDGTGLDVVVNDGLVSHAEWRDPEHILAWANARFDLPPAYQVFDVLDGSYEVIGKEFLREDGHMSFHKDGRWLLTDTYPDEQHMRTLKLYHTEEDREVVLGRFHAPPDLKGELRCDLHPCWNRDGTEVAIDSIHEGGKRQVYVIEVGSLDSL